jgi:ABC-type iron transport system FetAB ATPase subunit
MSDDIPIIKPINLKEYEVKQSKYNIASKLPIRSIILGPSGSGKSIITKYDIRYI